MPSPSPAHGNEKIVCAFNLGSQPATIELGAEKNAATAGRARASGQAGKR
jgi:hypothetical protein